MQQMTLHGKLLEKRYGLISGKEEQSKREKSTSRWNFRKMMLCQKEIYVIIAEKRTAGKLIRPSFFRTVKKLFYIQSGKNPERSVIILW